MGPGHLLDPPGPPCPEVTWTVLGHHVQATWATWAHLNLSWTPGPPFPVTWTVLGHHDPLGHHVQRPPGPLVDHHVQATWTPLGHHIQITWATWAHLNRSWTPWATISGHVDLL
ncbi:hypothetical protein DUI87_35424 [Hirundo rustica rustica]|uniref:Uncharacterized protein n=1 Tax=Hirundo rustica rustica TaxID=333673 RepID=A0A3M0IFC4_HIRRU|nr:hypothetical protein DUI87_35424 [Hirundo rustica rustica]